ncbi:MAG: YncE family protein [Planctomycetota bacterium]|jgi:YVTN family beta-propeller protein
MTMKTHTLKKVLVPACCMLLAVFVLAGGAWAGAATAGDASDQPRASGEPAAAAEKQADQQAAAAADPNRITREGLSIEFVARPAGSNVDGVNELTEGLTAEIGFRITDANTGKPVRGLYPVAYMDMAAGVAATQGQDAFRPYSCKDRVGLYLQGLVGIRPLIDLNSYFVMVMNQDPTISVIDPIIGIQGRTNLYAQVVLKRAGADWAKTEDQKRLFVSMPVADMVGVVDLERFVLTHNIPAGDTPTRVVLQQDEKYLWVGNDTRQPGQSGVTVIDAQTLQWVRHIPTGEGHHELALSADDRYAFVTNRNDGTVSVIDAQTLEKVKDLRLGPKPIALAYSALSRALYVADGETGEIAMVDDDLEVVTRIQTAPGLGPLRISHDGRWAIAVNPTVNQVYVIDTAGNRRVHTLAIDGRPFRLAFSDAFAYVRTLDTEYVHMINLAQLDRGGAPIVTRFQAGKVAPGKVPDLSVAAPMVEAPGEAAMLVVSPADTTVYYYMEGMNAPMGNFRNYGHRPRAVQVVDRTLKERQPGVYSAKVRMPTAGTYDVAFLLDTPVMLHCFSVAAKPNPVFTPKKIAPLAVEYLLKDRRVTAGETLQLRFRLTDPATQQPQSDLQDVTVLYYPASMGRRDESLARPVGDGIYEADLQIRWPQAYYVYVASRSKQMPYGKLSYLSLIGVRDGTLRTTKAGGQGQQGVTP